MFRNKYCLRHYEIKIFLRIFQEIYSTKIRLMIIEDHNNPTSELQVLKKI